MTHGADDAFAATFAALQAEKLRRSFAAYAEHYWPVVTGAPMQPNRATDAVIALLQRVADGEVHRALIALPSGVGKSTLLCLFAGWRLARDPSHRSIHMTHSYDLAGTESRRVRRLIESDEHRVMFPALLLRGDESTVAAWRTTRDGAYFAVGRDSALLGRRAHEAVLDDPADVGDRFSIASKAALWTWFEESLMTRLDGDRAPVIVVHQRTALDDLIGKLAAQRGGHGVPIWTLLSLPAEADDGTLLAPTILTREKLDEIKVRNPRVYKTMFLQSPDGDDSAAIARTSWGWHAPDGANPRAARPDGCAAHEGFPTVETPATFARIVISVDPTFGGTKSANDFCAVHAWGLSDGKYYLLDRWHRKAKQLEQRAALKALVARVEHNYGRVHRVLIEKTAGGAGLIEELEAEGMRNIEPVVPIGSKAERLEHVTPTVDRGFAFLPLGMHGIGDLVEECAGAAAHDDDPDAVQIALHWLNVNCANTNAGERHTALARVGYLSRWTGGDAPGSTPSASTVSHADVERARVIAHCRREEEARLQRLDDRARRGEPLEPLEFGELVEWRARQENTDPADALPSPTGLLA